jgi:hypothetical protein
MYAVIAESDKTRDIYVFKCDHEPDDTEFGYFVRDEYPDHFQADPVDWDDDECDYDSDEDDWDDDYSEGDDWDDDDCGGIAYMTIMDIIEIDEDQKSVTYEGKDYDLTGAKVIEGYV